MQAAIPQPPQPLLNAFTENNVVLYAGAGLSAESGFPLWGEFVESLLRFAEEQGAVDPSFAESLHATLRDRKVDFVADSVVSALRERRPGELEAHLREMFHRPDASLSPVHAVLRGLRFRAAMTTNFDDLLEKTFDNRSPRVYTPRATEELLTAISKREFFVLKLYGDIGENDVLVAPAQYEDTIRGNRAFSSVMETIFFSSTILFLGSSMEGIEAYLRGVALPGTERRTHYALVAVSGSAWRTSADILRRRYGIEVLPIPREGDIGGRVLEFVQQLSRRAARTEATEASEVAGVHSISRVVLHNIGPFESLELKLDPKWNVLLGDNGVGKSSILRAIATALLGRQAIFAERLLRTGEPSATVAIDIGRASYKTDIYRTTDGGAEINAPVVPIEAEGVLALGFPPLRTVSWNRPKSPSLPARGVPVRPMKGDLLPLIAGGLDPRVDDFKQWIIGMDYLARASSDTIYGTLLPALFETIGRIAEGMTIEFEGVDPHTYEITIHTDDGPLPLEALSQGTISLLGWVGLLMQRLREVFVDNALPLNERPAIVLIDEIDAHLHPAWQQTLVSNLSRLFPNIQFIATTHSPLIVGGMSAAQVFRFERDEEGKVMQVEVEEEMTVGRTDQILTSDLFGLATTLDTETTELQVEYRDLLGRSHGDEPRRREIEEKLGFRIPLSPEQPAERQAYQLLDLLLRRAVGGENAATQKDVLKAGERLLSTLAKKKKALKRGVDSPPRTSLAGARPPRPEEVWLDFWAAIDLGPLRNAFDRDVIGQDEAKAGMLDRLQRYSERCRRLLRGDRNAVRTAATPDFLPPIFCLFGAAGMGKTTIARLIGKHLFGSDDYALSIDLSSRRLSPFTIGTNAPYLGHDQETPLIIFARQNGGLGVIAFDEFTRLERDPGQDLNSALGPLLDLVGNRAFSPSNPRFGRRLYLTNTILMFLANVSPPGALEDGYVRLEDLGEAFRRRIGDVFYFEHLKPEEYRRAFEGSIRQALRREVEDTYPDLVPRLDRVVITSKLLDIMVERYAREVRRDSLTPSVALLRSIVQKQLSFYGCLDLAREHSDREIVVDVGALVD